MDIDKALVAALVREGKGSLKRIIERGVIPEFLEGAGGTAFKFALEYASQQGDLPALDLIGSKFGIEDLALHDNGATVDFLITEVLDRKLYRSLRGGLIQPVDHLDKGEPRKALETIEDLIFSIRQMRAVTGDTKVRPLFSLGPEVLDYYERVKKGEKGVPTPWNSLDDTTLGWWPEDLILMVARSGVGKCVHENSKILDPDTGLLRAIREVVASDEVGRITTWDRREGIKVVAITAKVDTGRKECLKVTLGSGRTIIVTPEHPFLTPEGWVRADRLRSTMTVGTPAQMPHPREPCAVDPIALAKLRVEMCLQRVNENVFRLPADQLRDVLQSYWARHAEISEDIAELPVPNEVFADAMQHLLLRFGIQTKKVLVRPNNLKSARHWRLRVHPSSNESLRAISEVVPEHTAPTLTGMPRVSDKLRDKIQGVVDHKAGYFRTRDLFGAANTVRKSTEIFCRTHKEMRKFLWWWDSGLYWDDVVSVEVAGDQKIYDLTVSPTSCFVANDIVVHNTWASLLLTQAAWEKGEKRVLYVTTEMAQMRIAMRFFALHKRMKYDDLRRGKLGEYGELNFKQYLEKFKDDKRLNIMGGNFDFRVESLIDAIDEAKPELIVFDGIYLLKTPGQNRTEQAANAFMEAKRICKTKKVPMVVTSQFNREVKQNQTNTVKAESVALTDAAVWNADLIFGLVQTEDYKKDKRMLIKQLKVREGVGEDIELNWDFDTMNFTELVQGGGHGALGDAVEDFSLPGGEPPGGNDDPLSGVPF